MLNLRLDKEPLCESFEHQVASAGAWVAATKQSDAPEQKNH